MEKVFNISEVICTRISHDLIGNIGAFSNAVELLEDDDDDFISEIKSTLKFSSTVLMARLKFFRMTFGLSNINLEKVDIILKTCEEYVKTLNPNYTIELDIKPIEGQTDLNRAIMLAVMVLGDIIVKGGKISVVADSKQITATATSAYPMAQSKINDIKNIINNIFPDNLAQYAPLFYLQKMGAILDSKEENGFILFVR